MNIRDAGTDDNFDYFSVEIHPDDIPKPSPAFVQFVRNSGGIAGLNRFTMPQFVKEARRRYGTEVC